MIYLILNNKYLCKKYLNSYLSYFYKIFKITHIYHINMINKLREENKGFSIFADTNELMEDDSVTIENLYQDEIPVMTTLNKLQIPFIWNENRFTGAYVKTPKKGIYLNVVDLDASSMYPTSLYITNNSPETWIYQVPENIALKHIYEREDLKNYIKEVWEHKLPTSIDRKRRTLAELAADKIRKQNSKQK